MISDPVKEQILDVYNSKGGTLVGTAFDVDSCMIYDYPMGLAKYADTAQPFHSDVNIALSAGDKVAAATAYPTRGIPPSAVGRRSLTVSAGPVEGVIDVVGRVGLYAVRGEAGQTLTVTVRGLPKGRIRPLVPLVAWLRNPNIDRGLPGNILNAMEARRGEVAASVDVTLPKKGALKEDGDVNEFYIEVRSKWPRAGTGNYLIEVARKT